MSKSKLELYKVEWNKMEQAPEIGDRERDFLSNFESDDGTFLISKEGLDGAIADWEETRAEVEEKADKDRYDSFTVPEKLVEYLRFWLSAEEGDFSVAVF